MCYRVNDLSKLKDYGFVNTYKDIYALNLNSIEDKKLYNDYSLNILVNANDDENGPNAITINYYANVQNLDRFDEAAGCDEIVDIGKIYDVINKMIADGVAYKVSENTVEEVDNESYEEICKEDYEPEYDGPDDNGDYYYDMMKDDGYHLDGGYWTF